MADPQDKPPAPGPVPQFIWPHQVTAPHMLLPPPPPESKKDGHGYDVAKLLGLVITIGTIIFGAGAANEKLKNIDANQSAAGEQQKHRVRLDEDRYEKLKSAFDALGAKVDVLSEQMKQQARARNGRRQPTRGSVDDRP